MNHPNILKHCGNLHLSGSEHFIVVAVVVVVVVVVIIAIAVILLMDKILHHLGWLKPYK